jgi:hypothetical protein
MKKWFNDLVAAIRQHALDPFLIAFRDHYINVEIAFSLVRLFRQNVSRMRVTAFNLAGRGDAKSLGRTLVCFQFWHNCSLLNLKFQIPVPEASNGISKIGKP